MAQQATSETPRSKALAQLAKQLPVANSRIAQQQQAARDIQLQQAIGRAPSTAQITPSAQTTGGAMAAEAGQQQLQSAQQQAQTAEQVGQMGLQEQARAGQERLQSLQSGAREQEMANVERLARISEDAKQELYDRQMQFTKDEANRTLFNERQLQDYARLNAQNDEQYRNYAQQSEQLHRRKVAMLEAVQNKLQERLKFEYEQAKQAGDQENMIQISNISNDMKKKISDAASKRANNKAAWQAGGTVVGAVAGGIFGGPAGAAAGGAVGGAIGGAIGGSL